MDSVLDGVFWSRTHRQAYSRVRIWFVLVLSEDFQWLDLKIKHQSDYKIDDEAGGHNQR